MGTGSFSRSSQARWMDNSISFRWATDQPSGTSTACHALSPGSILPRDIPQSPDPTPNPTLPSAGATPPGLTGVYPGIHSPVQQADSIFSASLGVGTDVYHLGTGFCIPLSRLPLDPDISGPTPFSSPQIPPSKGRVGNHTETTMYEALDQLWSPSPPYPLSCRSESRFLGHFPWPSGPPTGPVTIPPSLRLYASHLRTRDPRDQFPHCPILAQAVATERVSGGTSARRAHGARTARRTASNILVAALLARAPRLVLLIPRPEVVPVEAHAGAGGALDSYLANYSHGARTASDAPPYHCTP